LQSEFPALERYASEVYTREIFEVFYTILTKRAGHYILDLQETLSAYIYIIGKYCTPRMKWTVSYYNMENKFRCSCRRMESVGIPCCHILKVMINLNMEELPDSLVLERWSKCAKKGLGKKFTNQGSRFAEIVKKMKFAALLHSCREWCSLACLSEEDLIEVTQHVESSKKRLRQKHGKEPIHEGRMRVEGLGVTHKVTPSKQSGLFRRVNKRPQQCTMC